jgi:hypothetical protein
MQFGERGDGVDSGGWKNSQARPFTPTNKGKGDSPRIDSPDSFFGIVEGRSSLGKTRQRKFQPSEGCIS